jgi:hypothetical protein
MTCPNCGKNIPFTGTVCPYCRGSRRKDYRALMAGIGCGFLGLCVGVIFGVGLAVGLSLLGAVVGFVGCSLYQKKQD